MGCECFHLPSVEPTSLTAALLSRPSQAEAQSLLFEEINVPCGETDSDDSPKPDDKSLKLYDVLSLEGPRGDQLRRHLRFVCFADADLSHSTAFTLLLKKAPLPNLERLSELNWWQSEAHKSSPPICHRPRLQHLSTTLPPLKFDSHLLTSWFDLSRIKTLDLTLWAKSNKHLKLVFKEVSSNLEELTLYYGGLTDDVDFDGLTSILGRHHRLKVLNIRLSEHQTRPSSLKPLDILPSLLRFDLFEDKLTLTRPHLNLTVLEISILYRLRNPPEHCRGVRKKVESICHLKTERPSWLPALKYVATDCSFAADRDRSGLGLKTVAMKLAEAGLTMLDVDGKQWEAEWNELEDREWWDKAASP